MKIEGVLPVSDLHSIQRGKLLVTVMGLKSGINFDQNVDWIVLMMIYGNLRANPQDGPTFELIIA